MRICDLHCHVSMTGQVSTMADADSLRNSILGAGYEKACVQTITYYKDRNLNRNPLALMLKAENPDLFFAFGGIRYPKPGEYSKCAFASEARQLWEMGFDGLKLFAKPTVQGPFRLPLDAPQFMELYGYCQENGIPILFHVGDPSTFWDKNKIPDWALSSGWYYGEGNFPSYDEQYDACEHFLSEFPRLKVVFAHFFFLADDLPRISNMMRRYPNLMIDITPGSELYYHISGYPERGKEFFSEFADRIFYGTDTMGNGTHPKEERSGAIKMKSNICRFLETSDGFIWEESQQVHGINLEEGTLEKIYRRNFLNLLGEKPRKLNKEAVLNACNIWYGLAKASDDKAEIDLREFGLIIQRIKEAG